MPRASTYNNRVVADVSPATKAALILLKERLQVAGLGAVIDRVVGGWLDTQTLTIREGADGVYRLVPIPVLNAVEGTIR